MVKRYVKKPIEVYAVIWNGANRSEIFEFVGEYASFVVSKDSANVELVIDTLEGPMKSSVGDYVIKGIKGEFYACKPDVFRLTYDDIIK